MDEKPSSLKDRLAKYVAGLNRGPLATSPDGDKAKGENDVVERVEAMDDTKEQKPKRKERIKRHFKRNWWWYLIGSIVFLAIFLPLFFVYAIPAIAQQVVDDSTLTITSAMIMQPRPDSVNLTMFSRLVLPFGIPIRVDAMTLNMFIRELHPFAPYAQLYLPEATIHKSIVQGVKNQHTPILNMTGWETFVQHAVNDKQGPVSLKGTTISHIGKLKAKVTLDKDVWSNALNRFEGFSVQDSKLVIPPEPDGTNLVANATLPNPSIMTLEIGDVLLDLWSGNLAIGNATIKNLVIKPGNHSYPLRGILDMDTVMKNLPQIIASQRDALRHGNIALKSTGNLVTYEGITVDYYTRVMKNLTLTAEIPVRQVLRNTLRGLLDVNGTNPFASLNL
ncbi:hypothetical protein M432DRAFT_527064, partial [Thermoascus aurantiacus ATCC 26904]